MHEVVVSVLAVVSDCRDAASAVLPLHVMLVVFFLSNITLTLPPRT